MHGDPEVEYKWKSAAQRVSEDDWRTMKDKFRKEALHRALCRGTNHA